jgi:hypothetical protein
MFPPGFARRYFILQDSGHLSYSFGPGKPPRDEVYLPRAAISTAPGRKDIHIDSNATTFHIKCLSIEDFDRWMSAFRSSMIVFMSTRLTSSRCLADGLLLPMPNGRLLSSLPA